MGQEIESKLGKTPRILESLGLDKPSIDAVIKAQKEPQNIGRLSADIAVGMNLVSPEAKNIGLIAHAAKIASATQADYYALKGDQTLSGMPKTYYSGKVAQPNAVDAQQATADFAANMVKEMAADRALISCLGPKAQDMIALTAEIRKNPKLTDDQWKRLEDALETFTYHMNRLHPEQAQKNDLAGYTAEVHKRVIEGCSASAQTLQQTRDSEIQRPNVGGGFNPASGRHY